MFLSRASIGFAPSARGRFARPFATLLVALVLAACIGSDPDSGTDGAADSPPSPSAPVVLSRDSAFLFEVDVIGDDDRWVTGSTRREYAPSGNITVTEIRAAAHDGFDRFVVTLAGEEFPTHQAEISNGPAIQCGSGEPVPLPGGAVLTLRLESARAHDDAGAGTLPVRDLQPDLAALLEARLICDFEGQVEWAFGIADATAFRVLELTDPARVILDIRH